MEPSKKSVEVKDFKTLNINDKAEDKPNLQNMETCAKPFNKPKQLYHMEQRNPGCALDLGWIEAARVNLTCVNEIAEEHQRRRSLVGDYRAAWLVRAITCIDLTTLAGDDTDTNVRRLCMKAANPLPKDIIAALGFDVSAGSGTPVERITTAAVCVYPNQVPFAADFMARTNMTEKIQVASVASGFPSGQYPLKTRLEEIRIAVADGATEIDIVINRGFVLAHEWEKLYDTISQMRTACGSAHMKTILAAGELGSYTNIYKASLVAMMAGSDFIKTSTGKETVNATLPIGVVMCRAIKAYHQRTGIKVGFKPAGGIRTAKDALNWLVLMKEELGSDWLYPNLFRIGASGLLSDIEMKLYEHVTGHIPSANQFSMV